MVIVSGGDYVFDGNKLKQKRLDKGLTQEELGKMLNKTKNNISQYESGKRQPDTNTLKSFAEIFNCSIDYLLGLSDSKKDIVLGEFVPTNIQLIKGSMSWEEMSTNIGLKMNNQNFTEHYTSKYLQRLSLGKDTPTASEIYLLSKYAEVDKDFFFRNNTEEDLIYFRKLYKSEVDKAKQTSQFRKEVQDFLDNPNNLKYIEFAMRLKDQGINPDNIEGFNLKFK